MDNDYPVALERLRYNVLRVPINSVCIWATTTVYTVYLRINHLVETVIQTTSFSLQNCCYYVYVVQNYDYYKTRSNGIRGSNLLRLMRTSLYDCYLKTIFVVLLIA